MKQYDIIVVGGGMVGAATALGLARQGKTVALVERIAPEPFDANQPMDLRVSAISPASVELLNSLKVWDSIRSMRLCPYRRLETWEHEDCRIRFSNDNIELDHLGFIVENRLIQLGFWQACESQEGLTLYCPHTITSFSGTESGHKVVLDNGSELHAALLVGADGANSRVRDYAKIGVTAWDYRQHCMLVNVETELPQQDVTWQWFTPSGPRSFLPLPGHQASLVWYDSPERIRELTAMDNTALKQQIVTYFPQELGEITVINKGAFPLTRRHAQRYHHHQVVILGDAAHTINPLAGQGVNLGFKDVDALLDEVAAAGERWRDNQVLENYTRRRRTDNLLMQTGMDVFYAGFSNDIGPLKLLRNIGMKFAENSGPIKEQVLKYAWGYRKLVFSTSNKAC
ncbi:2-octaprenyl-3-methyl-6-methoxy-1,4-benzoquinol hydroxylase [Veronia nyctiphanis]|uniref:2-octaprenyl-3-methyl-6-methoxy-1,4-benzoquinol hydroxylase n=1 Tax=Veronia nyctiphanis TaxID=1278244 RepID=A0A4Q0YPT5_9GAMM|nr:2-octaprenyl-3-methyl-6-methoxy-1,4-benzoquinol hydroxylase [Veronia nyctiphanis]RXJ73080.1 2-octaprenyl-3-methyl-6-methoxy-1,4-benzoquinol hydroxylase [Veronia nyctiphanis]